MRASVRPIPDANASEGALGLMRQHRVVAFLVLVFALIQAIEIAMQIFQLTSLQFVVGWMPDRTFFHADSTGRSHRELGT